MCLFSSAAPAVDSDPKPSLSPQQRIFVVEFAPLRGKLSFMAGFMMRMTLEGWMGNSFNLQPVALREQIYPQKYEFIQLLEGSRNLHHQVFLS